MLGEFKEFIKRGNVMELAVAVIIGGAFGKIVGSLTDDVIMPVVGKITGGGVDFTNYFVALDGKSYATLKAVKDAGAGALAYGSFITQVINFLILAFIIFIMVKQVNRLTAPPPAPPPGPTPTESLLGEIRDLLKK